MRIPLIVIALLSLTALCWVFPLFHVVTLEDARASRAADFNAADYAQDFWDQRLPAAMDTATPAAQLVSAIQLSPTGARDEFGRAPGLGRTSYFFLRGSGTIVSIGQDGIGLSLNSHDDEPDLLLRTGLLFGNAARDATGLIDVSAFADSQHFNEISKELNRIIESTVLPKLTKEAMIGGRLKFAGAAEVRNEQDLAPLKVVPLSVHFE